MYLQRVAHALRISQPIFDVGFVRTAQRDGAVRLLYSALADIHKCLKGLPLDEDVDIDVDTTASDAPPADHAPPQTSDSTVLPPPTTSDASPTDHFTTPPMTYVRRKK